MESNKININSFKRFLLGLFSKKANGCELDQKSRQISVNNAGSSAQIVSLNQQSNAGNLNLNIFERKEELGNTGLSLKKWNKIIAGSKNLANEQNAITSDKKNEIKNIADLNSSSNNSIFNGTKQKMNTENWSEAINSSTVSIQSPVPESILLRFNNLSPEERKKMLRQIQSKNSNSRNIGRNGEIAAAMFTVLNEMFEARDGKQKISSTKYITGADAIRSVWGQWADNRFSKGTCKEDVIREMDETFNKAIEDARQRGDIESMRSLQEGYQIARNEIEDTFSRRHGKKGQLHLQW